MALYTVGKKAKQRDHSSFPLKMRLRRDVLGRLDRVPVVMETHGGMGRLWASLYSDLPAGVVFELDDNKAAYLARQRPTWAVYEADCEAALAAGAGAHVVVDLLDVDPYGSPWEAISGFLQSDRPFARDMWLVVQDGLRIAIRSGGAWRVGSLVEMIDLWGNDDLYDHYLESSKMLIRIKASEAGYRLARFGGYYCGYQGTMTHWAAQLVM